MSFDEAGYILGAVSIIALVWQWAKPRITHHKSEGPPVRFRIRGKSWEDPMDDDQRKSKKRRRPGYKNRL